MLKKQLPNNIHIDNWKPILEEIGYKLTPVAEGFRANAYYRGGDSSNSIAIYPDTCTFYDFPAKKKGTIAELIALSKNLDISELGDIIDVQQQNHVSFVQAIDIPKVYSENSLSRLTSDYSFFEKRGISKRTQKIFEAKYCGRESFAGRVIFPIRNFNNKIIGFSGRSINWKDSTPFPKWLIKGRKRFFVYNHVVATPAIKKDNTVILLESIGDCLSMYESGIANTICLFGLSLSPAVLKYLISMNPNIIISTNNDFHKNENRGADAAEKIKQKLINIFNPDKVKIILPPDKNDWGDILVSNGTEYIKNWYSSIK